MAEYGVVTQQPSKRWVFATKTGIKAENTVLLALLDEIGAKGWDVVAVGEFGGGGKSEILVRK